jgi:selenium metabolism protein YedF
MPQPKIIDNRGLSCPLPVVNTKKAMDELAGHPAADFMLSSLVDNETAAENVCRFARSNGCLATVEKKEDGFYVHINKTEKAGTPPEAALKEMDQKVLESDSNPGEAGRTVMLITSSTLGQGSEELGKLLMRSFIFTLKESDTPPERLLFLNGGINLTVEGSPVLDELQELAARGVEIFSCGTCLDYYQLKDKLKVGQVTNMYDTVDAMLLSGKCITV